MAADQDLLESWSVSRRMHAKQWQRDRSQPVRQLSVLLLSLASVTRIDREFSVYRRFPTMMPRVGTVHLVSEELVDFGKWTVPTLKDELRSRGLKVSGKKAELVERLIQHSAMEDKDDSERILEHCVEASSDSLKGISLENITNDSPASFSALGLQPDLDQAALAQNWRIPTDIQKAAIPEILANENVWAEAPTGSGKTAAFVLPLLQRLKEDIPSRRRDGQYVNILVLAPTRELVMQTTEAFHACNVNQIATIMALYGGETTDPRLNRRDGRPDVLVATPGRLLDVLKENEAMLTHVSTLLLDEADRLLVSEFELETRAILESLPPPDKRQTLLFSATFPYRSHPKAKRMFGSSPYLRLDLNSHSKIAAEGEDGESRSLRRASFSERYKCALPPSTILQRAIRVDLRERTPLLRHLIHEEGWARVLVFVGKQKTAERVANKLRIKGFDAEALHGKLNQEMRSLRLEAFQQSRLHVLVATNLAARGIDVQGLEAIVNYDLPRSTSDYTHRIGRTGRAGDEGVAVSFIATTGEGNEAHFQLIEKRHGNMVVPRETVEGFEPKAVDLFLSEKKKSDAAPQVTDHPLQHVQQSPVAGVQHSKHGLAHDRMYGGRKGRKMSKKDKLRMEAAQNKDTPET